MGTSLSVRVIAVGDRLEVTGVPEATLGAGGLPAPAADEPHARWRLGPAELVVTTDRYGLLPVFYWATGDRVVVAGRIETVLALGAPAGIDWDAVGVFLRLGYFLGERTAFSAVRVLPPGARFVWRRGGGSLTSAPPPQREFTGTRARLAEGFTETFAEAVRRRRPEQEYVLPLSGGRDSRHILLELLRQGAGPRLCLSGEKFRPDDAGDAVTAAHLATSLGLPHDRLGRPGNQLRADLTAIRGQNLVTVEGGWALPLAAALGGSAAVTFDGLGGDMLTGRTVRRSLGGSTGFDPGDLTGMAGKLLAASRYDRALTHVTAGWDDDRLSRDTAVREIARELARHAGAPSPWTSFLFWNRTRRAVGATPFALFGLFPAAPRVHVPFMDTEVFDLLMSAPLAIDPEGRLHDEVIARLSGRSPVPYASSPSGHGPGFAASRLAYIGSALAHVRRSSPPAGSVVGLLSDRLIRGCATGRGARALNRLAPMLVHLTQLERARSVARN